MVFVNQRIEIANEGEGECAVLEERTHVYLALGSYRRTVREGKADLKGLVLTAYRISHLTYPSARSVVIRLFVQVHAQSNYAFQILRVDLQRPPYTSRPRLCTRVGRISRYGNPLGYVRSLTGHSRNHITERLVHGPLTALMLLEALAYHHPEVQMKSFEYRALNPVIVNRELTFHGSRSGPNEIVLWVQDEAGVVGMKGLVSL